MERPSLSTVQVVRQHARHLIQHLPDGLDGTLVPDFSDHDFGALLSMAQYDGQGSVGKFGLFQGVSTQDRRVQLGPVLLYRAHHRRIDGFWARGLIWRVEDRAHRCMRPRIPLG